MLEHLKEKTKNPSLLQITTSIILLLVLCYGMIVLQNIERRTEQMETRFNTGFEQLHVLLNEQNQAIGLLKDHSQEFVERTDDIIKSVNQLKGMQQALADLIDQQFLPLDEKLKALTQPLPQTPHSDVANNHYAPAEGYRIFGVQPYGVVVATPDGRFVIARVGQPLAHLGIVKVIGAHKIIVGQSIITDAEQRIDPSED
jgi:hypothetical protein